MSKNEKGYLLAESIIAIAVVATIITVVYTLSMGNYVKQNNELTKENTSQDLYIARELRKFMHYKEDEYISEIESTEETDYVEIELNDDVRKLIDIKKAYITKSDMEQILESDELNNLVKNSIKKMEEENSCRYKYMVIYNNNSFSIFGIRCSEEEVISDEETTE